MNGKIRCYQDLQVWQKAMDLADSCYELSDEFPPGERFSLTSQLRRAALSVPSNIAEGHARTFTASLVYHLDIALGSQAEIETCLELARRRNFAPLAAIRKVEETAAEVGRLLHGLARSLSREARSSFHSPKSRSKPFTLYPKPFPP